MGETILNEIRSPRSDGHAETKTALRLIEAPFLFEAKANYMFE